MANLINDYYKTKYKYSEGEKVEKDLYKYISDNVNFDKIIKNDDRWTVFYHLTDIRKGILSWYPFDKNANCLEIGGGLGAITGLLCEKCKKVTTIEMSEIRAKTLYNRHKNKDNLDIYIGDIKDIKFKEQFDYITLIGVLEYQGRYSNDNNPYVSFLQYLKKLLKPDGKLLIAIENRFGLKYWCGMKEDHTALPFDGINNYQKSQLARTFNKNELTNIIKESGFKNTKFYYPLPDYKLPNMIFTDDYLPKKDINNRYRQYYLDYSSLVLDEMELLPEIIDNGVFPFFANSFFVECSDSKCSNIRYVTSTYDRKKELQLATIITDKDVKKMPLSKEAINEINITAKNMQELMDKGINVIDFKLNNNIIVMDYVKHQSFDAYLLELANKGNISTFKSLIESFYKLLLKTSDITNNNYIIDHKLCKNNNIDFGPVLKRGYIDFLFHNAFYDGDNFIIFDQEFVEENIPASFMIYRSLKNFYYKNEWLNKIIKKEEIYEIFNMKGIIKYYDKLDDILLKKLYNDTILEKLNNYYYYNVDNISKNQDMLSDANKYINLLNENKILQKNFDDLMISNDELNSINVKLSKANDELNNINVELSKANNELNDINMGLNNSNNELLLSNNELKKELDNKNVKKRIKKAINKIRRK